MNRIQIQYTKIEVLYKTIQTGFCRRLNKIIVDKKKLQSI